MTFSTGWGIPKNSILRRGTLIIGVPRQKTQSPEPSDSDPMAAGAQALEDELQKSIADRNRGRTDRSPLSASTTRKPYESTTRLRLEQGVTGERENQMKPPETENIEFCRPCSLRLLDSWKGWPNKDAIPILPVVNEGKCGCCGAMTVDLISNRSLTWMNFHGPYNTGLPDYWEIVIASSTWGLPYFARGSCPKCQRATVISQLAYPDGSVEFKHNCQNCGVIACY